MKPTMLICCIGIRKVNMSFESLKYKIAYQITSPNNNPKNM